MLCLIFKDISMINFQTFKVFPSQLKDVNLLETYMQPENTSVTSAQLYSQQRQRMDAIRQTALALRYA